MKKSTKKPGLKNISKKSTLRSAKSSTLKKQSFSTEKKGRKPVFSKLEYTIVISLGGSIIIPESIDTAFLKKFRKLILDFTAKNNRVIIVAGGGKTARDYMSAADKIASVDSTNKDLIGIRATKLNAELLRSLFKDEAYPKVIENPSEKINTTKKILIASGWKPGFSSDTDAVILAENHSANTIINISNISHIYNKDPNKSKDAVPYDNLSWKDMKALVGTRWIPGANLPFDPIATKKAAKLGLKVIIIGNSLSNLRSVLDQKPFTGTIIEDLD